MSAIGIDCGTINSVIGITRKKGIDILTNESSNRQTPSLVTFSDNERLIGEPAATGYLRNLRSTFSCFKRFIGRHYTDQMIQKDIARVGFPIRAKDEEGHIVFPIQYQGEEKLFTPEQVVGMMLGKLKTTVESHGVTCRDVVLSVPGYWSERERRAYINGASIAGLNVVRVLSEHAATALNFGFYKTDLDEKKPRKVLFIDMGYASTSVSISELYPSKVSVKSAAYDPHLGGRDFDEIIAEHFLEDIKKKNGNEDIKQNKRSWIRLLMNIEKQVKRVISSGSPQAQLNIECLMNDRDYSSSISRDQVGEIIKPLLGKIDVVVNKALSLANLDKKDIDSIEITGGASRFLFVIDHLRSLLGKEISRSINCEESVARGCALMAAMISPAVKVRDFTVEDVTPYAIRLTWKTHVKPTDEAIEDSEVGILIKENNVIPAPKLVKFNRKLGIEVSADYEPHPFLEYSHIAKYIVPEIPPCKKEDGVPHLRLRIRLSNDGLLLFDEAETVEELEREVVVEVKEPIKSTSTTTTTTTTAAAAAAAANATGTSPNPTTEEKSEKSDTQMKEVDNENKDDNENQSEKMEVEEKSKEPEIKVPEKQTRIEIQKYNDRQTCKFTIEQAHEMSQKQRQLFFEEECQMMAADKLAIETSEAKNRLESYCYSMQSKAVGELSGFIDPALTEGFLSKIEKSLDWVYDEGAKATKGIILAKLKELTDVSEPAERRFAEKAQRPEKISELQKTIVFYQNFVGSEDERYAHITMEDREPIEKKCKEVEKWLSEMLEKQSKQPLHADPMVTCAAIEGKVNELKRCGNPIMSKPKPEPKKEEKKEEPLNEKKEEKKDEPMDEEKAQPPPIEKELKEKINATEMELD